MNRVILMILITGLSTLGQLATAQELLTSKKSWDGSSFSYPTTGEAEMTAVRIVLKENEQTPDHCHPVPVFGYMLSGTIEVKTTQDKHTTFTKGDALAEVMNTVHNGKAIGGDAEILAFYTGSSELPNTVIADGSDSYKTHCQP